MSAGSQSGERAARGTTEEARLKQLFSQLWARSGAGQYGIAAPAFACMLAEIGARYLPPDATSQQASDFYSGLHLEELALARGCAAGHEAAWEHFLIRYREKLYDAALAIAREQATARELADSLYADLFGTSTREGERVSKLASYMGRGSLEGWLRTVLAQEYVNRWRRQRRLVSLEEKEEEAGAQFEAPAAEPASSPDPRLEAATDAALASLPAEDRFILASYYLDGRTLADIARQLGVHESTISRRVEKIVKSVRKQLLAELARRGMSRRQAEEALDTDVRDLSPDVRRGLAQEAPTRTFPAGGEG